MLVVSAVSAVSAWHSLVNRGEFRSVKHTHKIDTYTVVVFLLDLYFHKPPENWELHPSL